MKYILMYGTPVDGFGFIGPFDNSDDVIKYGELNYDHIEWWVIGLEKPVSEFPQHPNEISEKTA